MFREGDLSLEYSNEMMVADSRLPQLDSVGNNALLHLASNCLKQINDVMETSNHLTQSEIEAERDVGVGYSLLSSF